MLSLGYNNSVTTIYVPLVIHRRGTYKDFIKGEAGHCTVLNPYTCLFFLWSRYRKYFVLGTEKKKKENPDFFKRKVTSKMLIEGVTRTPT